MDCEIRKRRLNEDNTRSHSFEMSSRYIPEEIVLNVLPRLPTKSRVRFRCVSKPWCRWISDIRRLKVLIRTEVEYEERTYRISFFSIEQNLKLEDLSDRCGDDDIWYSSTPEIRDMVLMNKYKIYKFNDLFLLNSSISGYYEHMHPHHKLGNPENVVVMVVSRLNFKHYDYNTLFALCPRKPALIFALQVKEEADYCHYQIVYFDSKTNKFEDVPTPELSSKPEVYEGTNLCVFDGCLCIVRNIGESYSGNFEILVMREYCVKESWSTLFKIELGRDQCYRYRNLEPLFYTEDKEMVLVRAQDQIAPGYNASDFSAFDRNGKFCFKVWDFRGYQQPTTIVWEETFVRPTWNKDREETPWWLEDDWEERYHIGGNWEDGEETTSYAERTRQMLLEL